MDCTILNALTKRNENCVLLDKATGKRYKITISYRKLMLIRLLQPVSYVLYGLIVISILMIFGPFNKLSIIILIIAYLINIPMSLSGNGISFVDRIHAFLVSPITHSTLNMRTYLETKNFSSRETLLNVEEILITDGIIELSRKALSYINLSIQAQSKSDIIAVHNLKLINLNHGGYPINDQTKVKVDETKITADETQSVN
ncbi:MAG TPA: hypothetical protein VGK06_06570 [Methanosarcina sp.]